MSTETLRVAQLHYPDVSEKSWIRAPWFIAGTILIVVATFGTALLSSTSSSYWFSQMCILLGTFIALWLLSDRPLINPVQAVVAIFYWWVGAAPVVIGGYYLFLGDASAALRIQEAGLDAQFIVALGLPLYAAIARVALQWLESSKLSATFLMPNSFSYTPLTLLAFWAIGTIATVLVIAFRTAGVEGITFVNYLGGTRTDVWWLGVLDAISDVIIFASVGAIAYLFAPKHSGSWWLKLVAILILVQGLATGITSGSRGPMILLFFYTLCAYVSYTKRIPWHLGLVLAIVFLFIVDPFVTTARQTAIMTSAQSTTDRTDIFLDTFLSGRFLQSDVRDVKVEQLFRGIYPLAGELTRKADWFDGYWKGETVEMGLQALIPRALAPDKPEMNVGNLMSRTIGTDLGLTDPSNYLNSIAVSLPFEFVGNYGWVAGLFTFLGIGFFWSLLTGFLLSPSRLSTHPLAPWLVGITLNLEQPFGHYLATFRDMVIPLAVAFALWILLRKHL